MTRIASSTQPLALAAGLIGAGAFAFGLFVLVGEPKDAHRRLAGVQAAVARADRLGQSPGSASRWRPNAVCRESAAAGATAYAARLNAVALTNGVKVTALASKPAADVAAGDLERVDISLDLAGDYAALTRFLAAVEHEAPTMMIDSAELRPRSGTVELRLKGVFWCWA